MSKLHYLSHFRTQIIDFSVSLAKQFPEEPDLLMMSVFVQEQISIQDLMMSFITYVMPLKKKILDRDESFFLSSDLFSKFELNKVVHFKDLWKSERLDAEDKQIMWNWFTVFITLADKYITAAI